MRHPLALYVGGLAVTLCRTRASPPHTDGSLFGHPEASLVLVPFRTSLKREIREYSHPAGFHHLPALLKCTHPIPAPPHRQSARAKEIFGCLPGPPDKPRICQADRSLACLSSVFHHDSPCLHPPELSLLRQASSFLGAIPPFPLRNLKWGFPSSDIRPLSSPPAETKMKYCQFYPHFQHIVRALS